MDALPGANLVLQGLADLSGRKETVESLLVSIAATRLAATGLDVADPFQDPEHRLYALLAAEDADSAHGRYTAFLRQLSSYARAAECAAR